MKSHSGVLGNDQADMIADVASLSAWHLPPCLNEHFLVADGGVVSANSRHFVQDIFHSINRAHWEVGLGSKFLPNSLLSDVDWHCFLFVWHLDLHMASGFTMAVRKHLYNRHYPSVLCLHCSKVEVSWSAISGLSISSSDVLQLLSTCVSDVSVSMALFKGFVFNGWYYEAISFCSDPKLACSRVVEFVWSLGTAFKTDVWLVCVKYHAFIEKNGRILSDRSIHILISGLGSRFSAGIVRLLGVAEAIGVHFGFRKQCVFFLVLIILL
ncbi:hypothetical protein G9A89_018160 [Geosiphon pyriformis]|nr:hypothetical protein G9A89_018160 [Geosiphon pyriformis]